MRLHNEAMYIRREGKLIRSTSTRVVEGMTKDRYVHARQGRVGFVYVVFNMLEIARKNAADHGSTDVCGDNTTANSKQYGTKTNNRNPTSKRGDQIHGQKSNMVV